MRADRALTSPRSLRTNSGPLGITNFYVIPPIRPRGVRDYTSAADLIDFIKALPAVCSP